MRLFKPNKIIVHHSLTEDSGTANWLAIMNYHTKQIGWNDIGFHAGVELVKNADMSNIEVFIGRSWLTPGAHTQGYNHDSLGICFVGDFDKRKPSDKMLIAGAKVIRMWMNLYRIPRQEIYTHNNFNPNKTCPGKKFPIERLRDMLI